jgi:hypothetical protein
MVMSREQAKLVWLSHCTFRRSFTEITRPLISNEVSANKNVGLNEKRGFAQNLDCA